MDQVSAAAAGWKHAGLTIGTGTDIWQLHTAVHMDLEELVKAGLTPLEAIRAGTLDAARSVGIEREVGLVEVGKWADLVVEEGDPGMDAGNAREVLEVVERGWRVDRGSITRRVRGKVTSP